MKTKVQQYVEGAGGVRMWSFSPAVDMMELMPTDDNTGDAPVNICSLMAGDISSCLKTMMAMRLKAQMRPINVYMAEKQPEVLARHVLLLAIFFDNDLGPRECTEMFLEVYGNSMLRKQTSAYVHAKVEELVSFLTNGTGLLAGLIDVSSLKFKERDALEKVFKTWHEEVECDMLAWREKRLRSYYEDRYDYRKNLIDWDYSMHVKDWAEIIHSKLFLWWRQDGCAFEIRDAKMPQANRSLASYAEGREKGWSKLKRGFWGDVVQSPYWALGVAADEKRLFKKRSMQHTKTCQHVCEYNIYSMLHAMATGRKFVMPDEDDEIYGRSFWSGLSHGDTSAAKVEEVVGEDGALEEGDRLDLLRGQGGEGKEKQVPAGFKVHLLLVEDLEQLAGKKKFAALFDVMLVSNQATHVLASDALTALLRDRSAVVCEGAELLLNLNKDDRKTFNARIVELAQERGCSPAEERRKAHKLFNDKLLPLYFFDFDRSCAGGIAALAKEAKEAKEAKDGKVAEQAVQAALLAPTTDHLPDGKGNDQPPAAAAAEDEAVLRGSLEETLAAASSGGAEASGEGEGKAGKDEDKSPIVVPVLSRTDVGEVERGSGHENEGKGEVEGGNKMGGGVVAGPFGFCCITGLAAKYKDPMTGLAYANVAAFKELRRRHAEQQPEQAQDDQDQDVDQDKTKDSLPLQSGPSGAEGKEGTARGQKEGERSKGARGGAMSHAEALKLMSINEKNHPDRSGEGGEQEEGEEEEVVEALMFQKRSACRIGGAGVL